MLLFFEFISQEEAVLWLSSNAYIARFAGPSARGKASHQLKTPDEKNSNQCFHSVATTRNEIYTHAHCRGTEQVAAAQLGSLVHLAPAQQLEKRNGVPSAM